MDEFTINEFSCSKEAASECDTSFKLGRREKAKERYDTRGESFKNLKALMAYNDTTTQLSVLY